MTLPLSFQDPSALATQLTEDALIYNALNPGVSAPLLGALTWGRETFAEYAMTLGSASLGQYLPIATSNGNIDAFITGVFGNALGRAPSTSDLSFYEHVAAAAPSAFVGFSDIIMYVGLSPESYGHNHGLGIVLV